MLVHDSHCHLDYIQQLNIHDTQALIPGVTLDNNTQLAKLRADHSVYKIGFGIHPWFIDPLLGIDKLMYTLEDDIKHLKPDCIGEIGIDYNKPYLDLQKELFTRQLELAKRYNLPIIIHSVKAYSDILGILKKLKINRGIIHGFNANAIIAHEFTKLGFLLGIGSLISQDSRIKQCIAEIPLEYLVIESDAPFMPLHGQTVSASSDTFLYAQLTAKQLDINLIDLISQSNLNLLNLFTV